LIGRHLSAYAAANATWISKATQLLEAHRSFLNESSGWDIEDYMAPLFPKENQSGPILNFVRYLAEEGSEISNAKSFDRVLRHGRVRFKLCPKMAQIRMVYKILRSYGMLERSEGLERFLVCHPVRSLSGVLVITVFTSPYPQYNVTDQNGHQQLKTQRFSCRHNCFYCPNEPDMPRSYISDEPGVRRARRHGFDAFRQFIARATAHWLNGHPVDKIELLVLGGTWTEYPHQYQETFLRDIFYAANTFANVSLTSKRASRAPLSLQLEQEENERSLCRIIGVTLETRPDSICGEEIRRMRRLGCTRVQLGIQHTNDLILKKINRGCTTKQAIQAVRMLKDSGFKIDFHLMPDLPGSTAEKDREMFDFVLNTPHLQADQWKIYPCQVTPWTVISKWFEQKLYTPYPPNELLELIVWVKARVPPWVRLNRIIRDIPSSYVLGGNNVTNLREAAHKLLLSRGGKCVCIRCREVRDQIQKHDIDRSELVSREYNASFGKEVFLSFESEDRNKIYGFCRLRLSNSAGRLEGNTESPLSSSVPLSSSKPLFPTLIGCALIRELHVYGRVQRVAQHTSSNVSSLPSLPPSSSSRAQHLGLGRRLMAAAEAIATANGFKKCAVIAGIGAREYYRGLGYRLEDTYMVKDL